MIKTFNSLMLGKGQLKNSELPLFARYFWYLAGTVNQELLARLWPHIPVNEQEDALAKALECAASHGNTQGVVWLLDKLTESGNEELFLNVFSEGGGLSEYAARSGSIETFDVVISYLAGLKEKEVLESSLIGSAFGVSTADMLEHIIRTCLKLYDQGLVEGFLETTSEPLGRSIFDEPETTTKQEFRSALLRLLYEHLGAERTAGIIAKVVFDELELEERAFVPDRYFGFLAEAQKIAGIELLDMIFEESRPTLEEHAKDIGVNKLHLKFVSLCGHNLSELLDPSTALFEDIAQAILADKGDRSGEPLELINDLADAWIGQYTPDVEIISRQHARSMAFRGILKSGRKNDLQLFNEVSLKLGLPSIYPEVLFQFPFIAIPSELEKIDKPATFRMLFDFALKTFGRSYAETLLLSEATEEGKNAISGELLSFAIVEEDLPLIREVMGAFEAIGGLEVCRNIIRRNNYSAVTSPAMSGEGLTAEYFLSLLPEDERLSAAEAVVANHWANYYSGKSRRSDFKHMAYSGRQRWVGMTGKEAPDAALNRYSPYRFSKKLYEEVLSLITPISVVEGGQEVKSNAYKLSVLFSNIGEVDQYLTNYALHWGEDSKHLLHDACLFEVPESELWNPGHWSKLVLKYGVDALPYLGNAPNIEKLVGKNKFPESLNELKAMIVQQSFKRFKENPELATLCATYLRKEEDFNTVLDWYSKNKKTKDYMPYITIDGGKIGHPDYYLTRLAPDDLRGFFLGESDMTHCCQSIGQHGEDAALYGMSSPYSTFYVVKQKTKGEITQSDRIVAQSWAWINSEKNTIVWDSYERKRSIHDRLLQPFIEQFAFETVGKYSFAEAEGMIPHTISNIRLGYDGQTPTLNVPSAAEPAAPIDYTGKYPSGAEARDSFRQYSIKPVDHKSDKAIVLPPPEFLPETEGLAKQDVSERMRRIRGKYGFEIKAGIEIECYAVGLDGQPTSKVLNVKRVQRDMAAAGVLGRFEDENAIDYYGQYEVATPVASPLESVEQADAATKFLASHAQPYGLGYFDFSSLPFEGKEASSSHISLSLWADGKPLFALGDGTPSPLLEAVVDGMLDFQRITVLPFAQNDVDYLRFHNTEWSPGAIRAGHTGQDAATLRVANTINDPFLRVRGRPEDVRIENRLTGGAPQMAVAMAMTLASVEFALDKHFGRLEMGPEALQLLAGSVTESIYAKEYPLPDNRLEALRQFKAAEAASIFQGASAELARSIIRQHKSGAIEIFPAVMNRTALDARVLRPQRAGSSHRVA